MRGSADWQVRTIFEEINEIGESKHDAKDEAREEGARTWHEIAQQIGIYSYATYDAYRDTARDIMNHAKEEFGVKDIEKLSPEIVKSFLEEKIDQGVKLATLQTYAAAAEKLGVALNAYSANHDRGNEYNFSPAIAEARADARATLDSDQASRAYADPRLLISHMDNPAHQVAAQAQLESGGRLAEVTNIKADQLRPDNQIHIQGKGGKEYNVQVSPETYRAIQSHMDRQDGVFHVNADSYRADIKQAAFASGQAYSGSHGLRWNFAQESMVTYQEQGRTYYEALQDVSHDMGHERIGITEHYLR